MSSSIHDFTRVSEVDKNIIPKILDPIINSPKMIELELLNNATLRNNIINFAQTLKVAMSYRADIRIGCSTIIPWESNMKTTDNKLAKCISFNEKADLFYYLTYKTISHFNRILTVAVNINKTLKLHLHYVVNNRTFCPRYKIIDKDGKQVAYFNQRVGDTYIKNNLMRAMLSGNHGLGTAYSLAII
tara:strand:+ start:515 stop:1075 length:561 start_codon:yes stop_codon:yes gene_type:complete